MIVELDAHTREFYQRSLRLLSEAGLPFLVGGAYALARYTGIERHTKDLDLFVRPDDAPRVLRLFDDTGSHTEMTFPHWLGKVFQGDAFLDIIFRSGNGLAVVDDLWFEHGVPETVLGEPVLLCPPEEILWSKGFIQERERFDGADVAHMIRAVGAGLDWDHLLQRYGDHWRVLLGHLVLFGYIYPGEASKVPARVLNGLLDRLRDESAADRRAGADQEKVCQGPFLSRAQYLIDLDEWGYKDGRVVLGKMTPRDVAHWTAAIDGGK